MRYVPVIFLLFMVGCTPSITKDDLLQLNGYWQISKVEFPDGNIKEYPKLSTTVDYIEWDGSHGFRKKVQPKLDGTYTASDDAEAFEIREADEKFAMHYKNELSEWHETLITVEANLFAVVNESEVTYTYNRFGPLKVQ